MPADLYVVTLTVVARVPRGEISEADRAAAAVPLVGSEMTDGDWERAAVACAERLVGGEVEFVGHASVETA